MEMESRPMAKVERNGVEILKINIIKNIKAINTGVAF